MMYIQDTDRFMEKYRLLLSLGDPQPLPVTGTSMAPFLVPQRDIVWLTASKGSRRTGDIVLYQRTGGSYILHRIYKRQGNTYTMVGDAHTVLEPGIREEQILAKAVYVERKQRIERPGTFWWEFFSKVWIRIIPLRPALTHFYSGITHLFRRFS